MQTIKIKYHVDDIPKLAQTSIGDWIDVYAAETVFCPMYARVLVSLGFSMQLPEGYEALLAPRSSTFKTWGIIQPNSPGVIDNSYCGDGDIWMMPVVCLQSAETELERHPNGMALPTGRVGRYIRKGDKIGQFRIQKKMDPVLFEEVETLGNKDRGGFGSTGSR